MEKVKPLFLEPHYTVAELAAMWKLSRDTMRRNTGKEPCGVSARPKAGVVSFLSLFAVNDKKCQQ